MEPDPIFRLLRAHRWRRGDVCAALGMATTRWEHLHAGHYPWHEAELRAVAALLRMEPSAILPLVAFVPVGRRRRPSMRRAHAA